MKTKNPVAKHARRFNKPATHTDRKKSVKRGYAKHKGASIALLALLALLALTGCINRGNETAPAARIADLRGQVSEWRMRAETAEGRLQRLATPEHTKAYIAELEEVLDDPADLCHEWAMDAQEDRAEWRVW